MTDPIVGTAEDFTIEVLGELGGKIRQSALDHVAVDDDHLARDAKELPQLLFYYQAAFCRLNLRAAQEKIRLQEAEANAYLACRNAATRVGEKITSDEIKARVTLDPAVQEIVRIHAEIEAKASAVRGILDALRQKGYSLQLVASIRGKEEDWLRHSFADRFTTHPQRDQIISAFNALVGRSVL